MPSLTELLKAWQAGDKQAESQLINLVQEELRELARSALRSERDQNRLQTTEMLSELYLRLNDQHAKIEWKDRNQFYGFSARILRQILVDAYRSRDAAKRGGDIPHLVLDTDLITHNQKPIDFLELHHALEALEQFDPQKAQMVEMRFFGGMSHEEVADALDISSATAKRGWRVARAWLLQHLTEQAPAQNKVDSPI